MVGLILTAINELAQFRLSSAQFAATLLRVIGSNFLVGRVGVLTIPTRRNERIPNRSYFKIHS